MTELTTGFDRVDLPLEHPFTIARGTTTTSSQCIVTIEDANGIIGRGSAVPSGRYGESIETVEAVLPQYLEIVESIDDPHAIHRIERRMIETVRGNPSARAAVEIAVYDLVARRYDTPLYRYLGLDPTNSTVSSYTIGIDDLETMREKTKAAVDRGFPILKVKVGTDYDAEILRMLMDEAPNAHLYVDANEAWTPREAVERIDALSSHDVAFVEQPVDANDKSGMRFVYERASLPIAADESCVDRWDVPEIAEYCDIANIKLMKCGGITEAIRMIHTARAHGLEVMMGCMTESNASIAAACHLTPLLDYADLDGSLLLSADPYDGVSMPAGSIDLEQIDRPGTGVEPV